MNSPENIHAMPRKIDDAGQCYFYHTMDIPNHGQVTGEWDLRGQETTYLGGVDFDDKSVLEIGTASGHLCFWMEAQGADVTAFDLDSRRPWDLVPYFGSDHTSTAAERAGTLEKLNNSWWFTHRHLNSKAKCIYGSIYDLDDRVGTFDVVTLCSILLHLRDPIRAIELACARSRSEIIITDVSEYQFLGLKPQLHEELCLHFLPRADQRSPVDSWYFLPAPLVVEVVRIFGFPSVEIHRHAQKFKDGYDWQFYTVVGRRTPPAVVAETDEPTVEAEFRPAAA
jgi:SAM-dependent methyltransferase